MQRPRTFGTVWPPLVVALAHLPMAYFAFQSAAAYPPLDTKRPWIVGFVTALVFLSIPWFAPALIDVLKSSPVRARTMPLHVAVEPCPHPPHRVPVCITGSVIENFLP